MTVRLVKRVSAQNKTKPTLKCWTGRKSTRWHQKTGHRESYDIIRVALWAQQLPELSVRITGWWQPLPQLWIWLHLNLVLLFLFSFFWRIHYRAWWLIVQSRRCSCCTVITGVPIRRLESAVGCLKDASRDLICTNPDLTLVKPLLEGKTERVRLFRYIFIILSCWYDCLFAPLKRQQQNSISLYSRCIDWMIWEWMKWTEGTIANRLVRTV